MTTKHHTLHAAFCLAMLGLTVAACSSYDERRTGYYDPPGNYSRSATYTDANGTTYQETNVKRIVRDADGNEREVVEYERTKDPKGLFNKQTVRKKRVIIDETNR